MGKDVFIAQINKHKDRRNGERGGERRREGEEREKGKERIRKGERCKREEDLALLIL